MGRSRQLHCGKCGELKYDNGTKLVCRSCNRKRVSQWAKENPHLANAGNRRHRARHLEKVQKASRASKIRMQYGLEPEDYDRMFVEQGGVCAICKQPETRRHRDGTPWNMPIDHDHVTGEVRGLLCGSCNSGIANFRDSTERLAAAIDYLNQHVQKRKH